jgi:hypothetical protein
MAEPIHYKKLPGYRRGFLGRASVWAGPDHLLLVEEMSFSERYKRYYFRDIQAIVVAKAPRFHISMRAAVLGLAWLIAYALSSAARPPAIDGLSTGLWAIAAALLLAWIIVSAFFSCRCRIYTAVSRDELFSVYRTWSAHQFLRRVQPLIQQAQGVLEGSWAQAVESRAIGPAETLQQPTPPLSPPPAAGSAAPIFVALTACLIADALWNLLTLHSIGRWALIVNSVLTLVEAGVAIAVIVQHYRGRARGAMQKLAIATLVAMGIFFYMQPLTAAFMAGVRASAGKQSTAVMSLTNPQLRGVDAVLAGALGLIGLGILLSGPKNSEDGIVYPST